MRMVELLPIVIIRLCQAVIYMEVKFSKTYIYEQVIELNR